MNKRYIYQTVKAVRTAPKDLERINKMQKSLSRTMAILTGRWMDEHKYEDINEYAKVIKRELPKGFTLERMLKRPFGFEFSIGTRARYKLTLTASGYYEWKRIA